jgi:rhamnose utilization protein RhaD (predicted bifunctional aldolase and dehydrogenase)
LIREAAPVGAQALAQCLGDVLTRVAQGASVHALTMAENAELLNWDAEKYRQTLNAR